MHLFTWLDIRTLTASQIPLAAAFAFVLFGLRRIYPNPRGSNSTALGFSFWVAASILLLAQDSVVPLVSVIGANLLAIVCYILLYRGVLSFFQSKGSLSLLYDVAAVAAAVVIYFSTIYDLAVPRIVALSVFIALARALMAVELFRHANGRRSILYFAGLHAFFAVVPVVLAALAIWPISFAHAGSASLGAYAGLQTMGTVADLIFFAVNGLFAATMFFDEIEATTEQQGLFDAVTGTLNRRAIEDMLAVEIARSSRNHSPVSVLLIEVDHFKKIVESYGRVRGDESLCTVINTVASILRFYDKCGRIADDKFLVVLPENAAEHALTIAQRFRSVLKDPSLPHDQPNITLSIGVTQCAFKEPAADVLARAELALREVHKNGRDGAALKLPNHQNVEMPQPDRIANRARVAKLIR
jgi:diguanylate cyclase (GGDEF)-like protein